MENELYSEEIKIYEKYSNKLVEIKELLIK